jgi:ankyrin repeat protein
MAAEEAVDALFRAVYDGVVTEVGRLLDEDGRLVEARAGQGHTPLTVATGRGHVAVVRVLLERGADIEASDEEGTSALHYAVLSSRNEECSSLFKVKAIPNLGREPLRERRWWRCCLTGAPISTRPAPWGVRPSCSPLSRDVWVQ